MEHTADRTYNRHALGQLTFDCRLQRIVARASRCGWEGGRMTKFYPLQHCFNINSALFKLTDAHTKQQLHVQLEPVFANAGDNLKVVEGVFKV